MGTTIEGITFYKVTEVSEILHCNNDTVRRYVKQGRLSGQTIGRSIMITETSLKKFLDFDSVSRVTKAK